MFGLSFTEVLIIAALALILLGPEQLPSAAKTLGKAVRELRRATSDLKNQFEGEMMEIGRNAERGKGPSLPPAPVSRPIPHRPRRRRWQVWRTSQGWMQPAPNLQARE